MFRFAQYEEKDRKRGAKKPGGPKSPPDTFAHAQAVTPLAKIKDEDDLWGARRMSAVGWVVLAH